MIYYTNEYASDATYNSDYLEHHGIPKQRWGVRKGPPYPLSRGDGKVVSLKTSSMTAKTKAMINSTKSKVHNSMVQYKKRKEAAKKNINDEGEKKFVKSRQRISEMSDDEIRARINRLRLEADYRKALDDADGVSSNGKVMSGKRQVRNIMEKVGEELIVGTARTGVAVVQKSLVNKVDLKYDAKKRARDKEDEANKDYEEEARQAGRKNYWAKYNEYMGSHDAKTEADDADRRRARQEASAEAAARARQEANAARARREANERMSQRRIGLDSGDEYAAQVAARMREERARQASIMRQTREKQEARAREARARQDALAAERARQVVAVERARQEAAARAAQRAEQMRTALPSGPSVGGYLPPSSGGTLYNDFFNF